MRRTLEPHESEGGTEVMLVAIATELRVARQLVLAEGIWHHRTGGLHVREGLHQEVLAGGNTLESNNAAPANCSRYQAISEARVLRRGKHKNLMMGTFGLINHWVTYLS